MSANTVVDLGNTCYMMPSIVGTPYFSGGSVYTASGTVIGNSVDLLLANTYCNLFAAGVAVSGGELKLQVQVSDSDVSGTYTDPTSGYAQFPGAFTSGTILTVGQSGVLGGPLGPATSGQNVTSGFFVAQGFIRNGRFARVNVLGESTAQFAGDLLAGFISQLKTTGSGGGFSFAPGSGKVNV